MKHLPLALLRSFLGALLILQWAVASQAQPLPATVPLEFGWKAVPANGHTPVALTATTFEGQVYAFAVGLEQRIFLQTFDPATGAWLREDAWTEVPGNGITDTALAAAATSDRLYLFAVGRDDRQVYLNSKLAGGAADQGWSGWAPLQPGTTAHAVAAVTDRVGYVHVFRTANDGRVYHTTDPLTHHAWEEVPGQGALTASTAPAAAYDPIQDRVYVFTVGLLRLSQFFRFPAVMMQSLQLGAWDSACLVPNVRTFSPVAAAVARGQMVLFSRTMGDDEDRIVAQVYGGRCGVWSGGAELDGGGRTDAAPAAVALPGAGHESQMMVLVKGIRDRGIYRHFFADGDVIPEVTTRNHYNLRSGDRLSGVGKYEYSLAGTVRGMTAGTTCPADLAVLVHGWLNSPAGAQRRFLTARASLRALGYYGGIVGFSWDSTTNRCASIVEPLTDQLPGDQAFCGFGTGKTIANGNGFKLAAFLDDFKNSCPAARIHLMGHSLGTRVILEAIDDLSDDSSYRWNRDLAGAKIDDVQLLGAAVDDNRPQTNDEYGYAIEHEVAWLFNHHSENDDVLDTWYFLEEWATALGDTGIGSGRSRPSNYRDVSAKSVVGDDHYAYWGYLNNQGTPRHGYVGAMRQARSRLNERGVGELFRWADGQAAGRQTGAGLPTYEWRDYATDSTLPVAFLSSAAVEWRDVPAASLGHPSGIEARFRAVYDYALQLGFVGAFPNFHQADYGQGVVYGTMFLRPGFAEWRDVPARELGDPAGVEARIRAVHQYAVARGFLTGYPNFHQADYGQGVVYGVILIRPEAGRLEEISTSELP